MKYGGKSIKTTLASVLLVVAQLSSAEDVEFASSEFASAGRLELREPSSFGSALVTGREARGEPDGSSVTVWDTTALAEGWQPVTAGTNTAQICVRNDAGIVVEGGRLVADAVWTKERVHLVRNWVVVPKDVKLTISEGTVVKFCVGAGIWTEAGGTVEIAGTEGEDVVFAAAGNDAFGGDTNLRAGDGEKDGYEIVSLNGGAWSDNGHWVSPDAQMQGYPDVSMTDAVAAVDDGIVRIPVAVRGTRNAPFSVDWRVTGGTACQGVDFTTSEGTLVWTSSSEGLKTIEIPLLCDFTGDVQKTMKVEIVLSRSCNVAQGEARVTLYRQRVDEKESEFASSEFASAGRLELREPSSFGSALVTGREARGEPDGSAVTAWDTTALAEGWQSVAAGTNTARICVRNDAGIVVEGGRLAADAVWTKERVHLVRNWVVVPKGVKLTISEGTVVKFCAGAGIWTEAGGAVAVSGAADGDVVFAAAGNDAFGGDTNLRSGDGEKDGYEIVSLNGGAWSDNGHWVSPDAQMQGYPEVSLTDAVADVESGVVRIPVTVSGTRNAPFSVDWAIADGKGVLAVTSGTLAWSGTSEEAKYIQVPIAADCDLAGLRTFRVSVTCTRSANCAVDSAAITLFEPILSIIGAIEKAEDTEAKGTALDTHGVGGLIYSHGSSKRIAYSTRWETATAASAKVSVCNPDGTDETLAECGAGTEGVVEWSPSKGAGVYRLTHAAGGSLLTAAFAILDDATEYVTGGTVASDTVWASEKVYVIDGTLTVAAGGSLTFASGVVVKFTSGSTLAIESGATCSAEGVIFTHIADDTVGGDTMGDGSETAPEVGAYTIAGPILDDETTQYRYSAPVVTSGTISKSTFWRSRNVYRVTGNLTIASGVTLTIMPGAIVKFDDGKSLTVNSGATLNAIGTRAQPIVFTSVKDDTVGGDTNGDGDSSTPNPGDWSKISTSGGTANMAHVQILYSSKNSTTGAINMNGGTVTFVDGLIAHGLYDAIGVESGQFHMTNSVVCDCLAACRHRLTNPIMNCVFYDCGRLTQGGSQIFVNCIFSKITETWEAFGFPHGTTYRNCCFWNEGGSVLTGEGRQDALTVCGKNGNIWGDPLFEDPDNGDFRIKVGSPCFDAGNDASAPERDHYNQPRNGQADIGIFELQYRAVKADIDLSLVSVTADASATIGGTLNISWAVENLGSANATGSWRDTFELIDASGATIKLGSYTVSGGIVAGGKRVFTTKFNVPSAAVGAARLRVKVNAERDVFEGMIMENNVAVAGGTIDLALATYTPDECSTLVVGAGSSTALTIPADSGITALIIRGGAGVSAYGAYGYMPKALRNDSAAVRLEDGSLLLTLPSTDVAGDFTFVIANGGYGAETVSIEPVTESLEITEVTPNRLANTGDGYLILRGIALDRVAQVRLVGGTTLAPTAFNAASSGELSATFPLADATPGTYALEVEDAEGETYRLAAAVEVYKPKMGPKLEAHLEIPTAVRQGRIYTGKICYSNLGDEAADLPLYAVSCDDGNTLLGYEGMSVDQDMICVAAVSSQTPAGKLKAGESGEISFQFMSSGRCNLILSEFSGADLSSLSPADVPRVLGKTELMQAADRLCQRGCAVCVVPELIAFVAQCANELPFAAISGHVVNESSGLGLEGVAVRILSTNDSTEVAFAISNSDGYFQLENIPDGAYRYALIDGNALVSSNLVEISGQTDVNGVLLRIYPGGTLQGIVYEESGKSKAGVSICLCRNGVRLSETQTDDSGSYNFANLEYGVYSVCVSAIDGWVGLSSTNVEISVCNPAPRLDVTLRRGGIVEGTVTLNGVAVTNGNVSAISTSGEVVDVECSTDGIFRFEGLEPDEYQIRYLTDELTSDRQLAIVSRGEVLRLNIEAKANPIFYPCKRKGIGTLTTMFRLKDFANRSGNFTSYRWDFDGDGIVDSTDPIPTHTYNAVGDYSVTL